MQRDRCKVLHAGTLCLPVSWLRLAMFMLRYLLFLQEYLGIKKSNLPDLFGVKLKLVCELISFIKILTFFKFSELSG